MLDGQRMGPTVSPAPHNVKMGVNNVKNRCKQSNVVCVYKRCQVLERGKGIRVSEVRTKDEPSNTLILVIW